MIQYITKIHTASQAVRWTGSNTEEVVEFMDLLAERADEILVADKNHALDRILVPTPTGPIQASIGDWLVKTDDALEVITNTEKRKRYVQVAQPRSIFNQITA